jgi:hypothetical protein
MRPGAALVLTLIQLTAADGSEVDVNPAEVVTLRVSTEDRDTFHENVHCVIKTVDGAAIGVRETCAEIRAKMLRLEE